MASEELVEELEALEAIFSDAISLLKRPDGGATVRTEALQADDAEEMSVQTKLELELPPEYPFTLPGTLLSRPRLCPRAFA